MGGYRRWSRNRGKTTKPIFFACHSVSHYHFYNPSETENDRIKVTKKVIKKETKLNKIYNPFKDKIEV
jgi:hypothetical protein